MRENSAYAIKKALTQLLGSGATLYMTYIHSHPDPSHGYAQTPTNPEDYDAVSGFGIHSGTMTTKSYIFFYKGEESSEIGISHTDLEKIINK